MGPDGSEAGSYVWLIDRVYHSTLGLRVIKKKISGFEILVLGVGHTGFFFFFFFITLKPRVE